jgi:hypothetical protein
MCAQSTPNGLQTLHMLTLLVDELVVSRPIVECGALIPKSRQILLTLSLQLIRSVSYMPTSFPDLSCSSRLRSVSLLSTMVSSWNFWNFNACATSKVMVFEENARVKRIYLFIIHAFVYIISWKQPFFLKKRCQVINRYKYCF